MKPKILRVWLDMVINHVLLDVCELDLDNVGSLDGAHAAIEADFR